MGNRSSNIVPTGTKKTNGTSSGRGRPKKADREAILERAVQAWWTHGFSALSLNELCRTLGISKPAMYREFGGLDELMCAALEHYRASVIAPRFAPLFASDSFTEGLEQVLDNTTGENGTPSGCMFTKMRLVSGDLGPKSQDMVRTFAERGLEHFADGYRQACERGEANADIAPPLAARYLDAQFAILLMQLGLGRDRGEVRQEAELALSVLVRS